MIKRVPVGLFFLAVACCITATSFAKEPEYPKQFSWGKITASETAVMLHVTDIPSNRKISLPRFGNPYKNVYLQSDAEKKTLNFKPEVKDWLVTLPKQQAAPCVVVIETVGKPRLSSVPFETSADDKGTIALAAHNAIVHGEKLRYEPQPHKNTVGYWAVANDWCEWKFKSEKPGKYDVYVLQGCGKGHGGSEVSVSVGESSLKFKVEDTGHFQNFKDRHVGTLNVPAGSATLKVVPVSKAKVAVMDVRRIRLVPQE